MQLLWVVLCLIVLPLSAEAGNDVIADEYLTGTNPALTPQEQAALAIGETNSVGNSHPLVTPNGVITFTYGTHQISLVCAPFHVCDVALQPGEHVNAINMGDNVRWSIEAAISGSGAEEVQHLIIKAREVGLETSCVVATNRRVYYMRLRSHRTRYMPQVAFSYPEDSTAALTALKARHTRDAHEKMIPATRDYLPNLHFNYEVTGQAPWKPVRVYNDGTRTVIQMPASITQTEAPVLLLVRKDGSVFSDPEQVMVNYNLQGDRYIVDTVFDKAVLLAGVGSNQDRVTIERRK